MALYRRAAAVSGLANDTLLRALAREPTEHTPIWLMRQAGRYLPEYRATREKAGSFMRLCTTPELACEVTLQPLRRFPLDAAILFSDILTIPDAMGLGLHFTDGEGPQFRNPVRSAADITKLAAPDPEDKLRYVMDAVRLIRRELAGEVPLIGLHEIAIRRRLQDHGQALEAAAQHLPHGELDVGDVRGQLELARAGLDAGQRFDRARAAESVCLLR